MDIDRERSTAAANEGIRKADENADVEWAKVADASVFRVARTRQEFIIDRVRLYLTRHYPEHSTHNMSALGAVMRRAADAGWIENTGRTRRSDIVSSHRDVRPIWRSLIYGGMEVKLQGTKYRIKPRNEDR